MTLVQNLKNYQQAWVRADFELFEELVTTLAEMGVSTLTDLKPYLQAHHIASCDDLVAYVAGPDCPNQLAVLIVGLLDRVRQAKIKCPPQFESQTDIGNYLAEKLVNHLQEELWVIYVSAAGELVGEKQLFVGSLKQTPAHPREIFKWAFLFGASGFFICHNHPSGRLVPSTSDLKLTERLLRAAKIMNVDFIDHLIVGGGHFLSMVSEDFSFD